MSAWWLGRPRSWLPGKTETSLVESVPGSQAGIAPSSPSGLRAAIRGGTEVSPALIARNPDSRATSSSARSSSSSTSRRFSTRSSGMAGPDDNAADVYRPPPPRFRADRGLWRAARGRGAPAAGPEDPGAPHGDPRGAHRHRGELRYSEGGDEGSVSAGELLLVNPGERHSYWADVPTGAYIVYSGLPGVRFRPWALRQRDHT